MDGVAVGAPLGVQGDGPPLARCQIDDILSISIGGSAAIGLSVPARKGVAGFCVAVGGQPSRRVIGHDLRRCAATVSRIAIELDGVFFCSPLGIKRDGFAFDHGQIDHGLSIGIGCSFAVLLDIPAHKGIAGFGIGVGGQVHCNVKGHWLIAHTSAISCISVKCHFIIIGMPLSKQGDDIAFVWCQVHHTLFIFISRTAAIGLSVPTRKGVAGFGVAVNRQACCLIIGHGLIRRTAAVSGVAVELDGIAVGSPLGVQGNGSPFGGCQIFDILSVSIGGSSAVGLSVPARKGVAGFSVAVDGQVGRRVIGHNLVWRTAAISRIVIELNGVAVGLPLGIQGNGFPLNGCQIQNILSVGISGSSAIGMGVPAGESVAGFSVAVGGQTGCRIISHILSRCATTIGGVAVELDGVAVASPLGVQGNASPFGGCQIYDILFVTIGGSSAIGLSIPAREAIARFGIAVNGQVGRRVIGHALV